MNRGSRIVLDSEVSEIRQLLQDSAGVLIDKPTEVLTGIVEKVLIAKNLTSPAELLAILRARPAECEILLEELLPGDTGFFRQPQLFQAFANNVLPTIQTSRNPDVLRPLRIWSAGCSTGEEAYSIGISVCEALQHDCSGWKVHIVAGDIRQVALETAERGLYPASSVLPLPGLIVSNYFSRIGDHFLVKPRLRSLVTFTHMNLLDSAFIGRFACIFCLDVLPHLSAPGRVALMRRLQLSLEPGGYIFLGKDEQFPAGVTFLRHTVGNCTYFQRPLAAAARAGR